MSKLKNADLAVIDPRKFTHYCLNTDSPDGKHKARVFKSALGYDLSNYKDLIRQIKNAIMIYEAQWAGDTAHGQLFRVDVPVGGPIAEAIVRTGWIYEKGDDVPRLTTAFVLRE